MSKLILVGFFEETLELIKRLDYDLLGVVDFTNVCKEKFSIPWLGNDTQFLKKEKVQGCKIIIAPDSPKVRKKITFFYKKKGYDIGTLIDPSCTVSPTATLSENCMIYKRANISSNVEIGDYVRVNSLANIMHDCIIGNYSTIAPNAVLLGNVKVGESSYIGANSTVLPNVIIGNNVIVGAGAVVTKNIQDNHVVVGNPAKILRKTKNEL